jgi:phosphoserine phosphatase
MSDKAVLVTITGLDRPGITAEISGVIADAGVGILDVEQAVVQGHLSLHFLLDVDEKASRPILMELLWKARELGVHAEFTAQARPTGRPRPAQSWAVTLVRSELGPSAIHAASAAAARHGFNIDKIERLSGGELTSIELILGGGADADADGLRRDLLALRAAEGCDVALQAEGLMRRSKRLVVMDMDSTLIRQEVIDEIARLCGVYDDVAAVTHRAMNGEIGFDDALRERCAKLAGAPESVFAEVSARIELTPGAERLVRALKRLGYRLAVISGGFTQVVEPLRQRLGLDYAFANELEVVGGKLTGRVVGGIVNRQRKADLLESIAQTERVSLEQVVAVGDGANDLDMLARAGLGIAFNAKKTVQEQAEYTLNQRNLDAILYLLGFREHDIEALSG